MQTYQFGNKIRFGSILIRIIKYMHQNNVWLVPLIVIGTIGAVISTYYPVLFQQTFVSLLLQKTDAMSLLQMVLTYFGVMMLASGTFALAHGYCNSRFSLIRLHFMADVNRKYMQMDYRFFEDASFANELENAMKSTQGNEMGFEYFMKMLFKLPSAVISIVILVILIGRYVPIILVGLVINVGVVFFVKNNTKRLEYAHRKDMMSHRRKLYYYSNKTADFGFGKDIRIFGLRALLVNGFRREIDLTVDLIRLFQNREFRFGLLAVLTLTLSHLLTYGSLVLRARQGLPIADFTMLLTASASLSLLLKTTIEDVVSLIGEARHVQGAFDFLDADLDDSSGSIDTAPKGPLAIEFRQVSFSYPGTTTRVLSDVSFQMQPGEKLAIVGVNGAGKSTLIKLLTGLYRPSQGDILINGISQSQYTKKTLYDLFSCVFQDIAVMPFDIRTNITISQEKTGDDANVWQALAKAGLKDKAQRLEHGLDQKLNRSVYDDAINLSGGEAQKLAIARALYKDANMVILDEPTAALDALAEQAIYVQLNQLIEAKTAIYISHRLASTQFCDRILLLDGSTIKEMGTHEELLALEGTYHHMFKLQGKYYQEGAICEDV